MGCEVALQEAVSGNLLQVPEKSVESVEYDKTGKPNQTNPSSKAVPRFSKN